MYRMLFVAAILASLSLPASAQNGPMMWAPRSHATDGLCSRRIAACAEACGPVDDKSDDSCVDTCVRVKLCGFEGHRSSRSNLPDSTLPASSLPDSRLPGDRLPDSRLP